MIDITNFLAVSVAGYILITFAFLFAGYLYGDYIANKDWKKAYLNLYQTAITEIVNARTGSGMDTKELVNKLQDLKEPDLKKRPTLSVVKSDIYKK
jgi:hypothetical protein